MTTFTIEITLRATSLADSVEELESRLLDALDDMRCEHEFVSRFQILDKKES